MNISSEILIVQNLRFSGQSNTRGKEWTFDTAADAYEKIRPGYPEELYHALFSYCPVKPGSRAVEVGIGGGQATLPVLKTGCVVTAVEYGEQLARVCREKFFDEVEETISRYGGFISMSDTIDLQLAKKPH